MEREWFCKAQVDRSFEAVGGSKIGLGGIEPKRLARLEAAAGKVAAALKRLPRRPQQVALLEDWIEETVALVVGAVKVPTFIEQCVAPLLIQIDGPLRLGSDSDNE